MKKALFISTLFIKFLFLSCEDYTEDFAFLNDEIERLNSENVKLRSLISDNTNSVNKNTAIIDQITNDILDISSSNTTLNS